MMRPMGKHPFLSLVKSILKEVKNERKTKFASQGSGNV